MSSINPKKLKVVELKRELENRNIPTTKSMKKADLVALLLSAIESESGQAKEFSSSEAPDDSAQSEIEEVDTQQQDPGTTSVTADASIEAAAEVQDAAEKHEEEGGVDVCPPVEAVNTDESLIQDVESKVESKETTPTEVTPVEEKEMETESENVEAVQSMKQSEPVEEQKLEEDAVEEKSLLPLPCDDAVAEVAKTQETSKEAEESTDANMNETKEDNVNEANEKSESKMEDAPTQKEHIENGKPDATTESKEPVRKRRHDDRSDRSNRWEDRYAPPEEEPEEEFDDNLVVLDLYNCDLNFKVSRDRCGGQPLTMEGFAYLWGGSRATYGVKNGKICFECKIQEEDAVKHLASDEPHPRVVRVGWSTDRSGLQLGEEALSFGYGGTGKFSVDRQFSDYGETFREGDVIGCYIDMEQDEKFELFFTKNGKFLGSAFVEEKSKLGDESIFPHVLCKNTCVELNFGQKSAPHFPHPEELEGYVFISSLPLEQRTRAIKAPSSKKECEVFMMCGLPGSGKTYWTSQKIKDEPLKKYNILGTNEIMNKMRVMGVARKKNYAGRWELLIQNANNCLNRLLQIASRKRRNYILDQTNVYASAQRRKMRPFEGFQRKAIVIVPTDEEYKKRFEKRTKDEGKEVPDIAVLEMKANFSLPEVGNLFDEVIFTELDQQEAGKLVEQYREEGIKNGPPPEKRQRGGDFRNRGGDGDWRSGRGFRGPPQMPYGSGGGWNRFGPPMGFGRGGFGPGGFRGGRGRGNFRSGGGFGNRQGGGGRDFNRNDRRDNFGGRRDNQRGGPNRNKGGWQNRSNFGDGGRGGMMGGYNKNNQGRSFDMNKSSNYRGNSGGPMQYHGRQQQYNKFQQGNRQNTQSNAPQSAQAYTYGHHPQQQQQAQQQNYTSNSNYASSGYGYQQPNTQQTGNTQMQSVAPQQQGYQQAYGQQDYSQQWAQYYQAQQTQQYQNYYANYQQYYNQQATQQTQPKS